MVNNFVCHIFFRFFSFFALRVLKIKRMKSSFFGESDWWFYCLDTTKLFILCARLLFFIYLAEPNLTVLKRVREYQRWLYFFIYNNVYSCIHKKSKRFLTPDIWLFWLLYPLLTWKCLALRSTNKNRIILELKQCSSTE